MAAWGCVVKYSFTGAAIDAAALTFSVTHFPNNATYVSPTLSDAFTNELIDRIDRQTRLSQVREDGDLSFSGEIVNWTNVPSMVSAANDGGLGAGATMNRLTITVRVTFTNVYSPENNFSNRSFQAFADFPSERDIMQAEGELIPQIVEDLVTQIYNAALANW